MAILGRWEDVSSFLQKSVGYQIIENYLNEAFDENSSTRSRIAELPLNTFQKYELPERYYAVEQRFLSKDRKLCFFESHLGHIDIQVMLEGEEVIEICHKSSLTLKEDHSKERDLLIYEDYSETHKILLRTGDVAVFFPEDGHMGTQIYSSPSTCVKTVVKMPVNFFRL